MKIKRGKEKDAIQLPHKMMQLESQIFTEILTRLFKKRGVKVVGIHDAVAIIDNSVEPEKVQEVMMKVFGEFGVIPTLLVERL